MNWRVAVSRNPLLYQAVMLAGEATFLPPCTPVKPLYTATLSNATINGPLATLNRSGSR